MPCLHLLVPCFPGAGVTPLSDLLLPFWEGHVLSLADALSLTNASLQTWQLGRKHGSC